MPWGQASTHLHGTAREQALQLLEAKQQHCLAAVRSQGMACSLDTVSPVTVLPDACAHAYQVTLSPLPGLLPGALLLY